MTDSISKLLVQAASRFFEAQFASPELDAKLLLQHASGYSSAEIISKSNDILDPTIVEEFKAFVERRLKFEPVHRITGFRDFYGREFLLSEATLIPRPDTETLVQAVIDLKPTTILEIGTGSGAIAVSLAAELSNVDVVATDISEQALETARNNASIHDVLDDVQFIEADLYNGVTGKFDLIVSNPPYIPSLDLKTLQKEVQFFDPARALDGGRDGLDFYREIFEHGGKFLGSNGKICVEIGIGQEDDVSSIARSYGFDYVIVIKDLNKINRVIVASFL